MLNRIILTSLLSVFCISVTQAFQDDQVTLLKKLTGASPIMNGVSLSERYEQKSKEQAAAYLKQQMDEFCDEVTISSYSKTGSNVVGIIKATQKTDQWVVLGAHFDSVRNCPGANDNATGVSLIYAVGQHIARLQNLRYNIYIVMFDEEERGLIGSQAFAKRIKKEGVNLIAAHTIDQMGWDQDGDKGIELEMPTDALRDFYLNVAKKYGFDFPIHRTNVTSTDHNSFRRIGFNAIGITEEYKNGDTTPYYHKSTDTFETVNLPYLKSTTDFMKKVFEEMLIK